jgi:Flp pilus assembly protein TadG
MSLRRIASFLKSRRPALSGSRSRRDFLRSERGAVAIYFGLSAIVFIGVAGLAVDAARGYLVKARLSEAIDAAALAGGKALQTGNNAQVIADAQAFFDANFPNGAMGATVNAPTINIQNNRTIVSVSSNAVIPTTLMRVLGYNNMRMVAAASVSRAMTGLDVVFSFDISGSMCDPCTKIQALQSNAKKLVDTLNLPFTSGGQAQLVTVNGVQYSLLNIGVVPWSSKVNVRTYPATSNGATTGPFGGSFTDPTSGKRGNLPGTYLAANSEVPLLLNPDDSGKTGTMPGGWTGCVWARYQDDSLESNDSDTTLGTNSTWPGWEPIARAEGENGGNSFWDCYSAYWNNGQQAPYDFTFSPTFTIKYKPIPSGWGTPPSGQNGGCVDCPAIGILPLQTSATTVKTMIDALSPDGATDAPQGLFWAWEVLMPGVPFDEAKVNPPFQRAQAIVFMTDGQNWGSNGDAYHGWFGDDTTVGTITSKGNITMPDGTSVKNNLNNRLLQLAAKIKGTNPLDSSAVKIYVIQYDETDATLTALLQKVATEPQAPYYYQADKSNLSNVFDEIAKSLTALRIVK